MRSSTSSSDAVTRAPAAPPLATLALTLLVAGLAVGGHELAWRRHGVSPSVRNTPDLWAREVSRADAGPPGVVLIGNSRMQSGVDPEVLEQELRTPVWNLSISGTHPLDALEFMSERVQAGSVIVVEAMPLYLVDAPLRDRARKWELFVAALHSPPHYTHPELLLDVALERHLAVMHPERLLRDVLATALKGRRNFVPLETMNERRYGALDSRYAATRKLEDSFSSDVPVRERQLERLARLAERLRARGARLVFLVAPVGPALAATLRADTWLAAAWPARIRPLADLTFDAGEQPALASVETYDHVHIDRAFVPLVCRALAGALRPLLARP